MDRTEKLNHRFASIGWGLLFIWWGVVVMVNPLTIGMGAIGTGLILLGINAGRAWMNVPTRDTTTTWGIIFLAWGALDVARSLYHLPAELSFAGILIVIGAVVLVKPLLVRPTVD
jgi:hypothetical protein